MAGKNRANTLSAILSNMDDLKGAYEDALQAEGSALRENEAYLDSIQGRIDLFTNALQTMWMNFLDDDAVKFIVDLGTAAIKLVDTLGLIPTALGAFAGFKAIKSIIGGNNVFTDFIGLIWSTIKSGEILTATNQKLIATTLAESTATKLANSSLVQYAITSGIVTAEQVASMTITELLGTAFLGLAAKIKAAAIALGQFLITTPVGWAILAAGAIAALVGAFDLLTTSTKEHAEALEEAKKGYEEITDTIKDLENELTTIKDRIDELNSLDKLSFAEEEELKALQAQSAELERQIHLNELLQKQEQEKQNNEFVATMESSTKDFAWKSDGLVPIKQFYADELLGKYTSAQNAYQHASENYVNALESGDNRSAKRAKRNMDNAKNDMESYYDELKVIYDEWSGYASGITYIESPDSDDEKAVNGWLDFIYNFQDRMAIAMDEAGTAAVDAFNRVSSKAEFQDVMDLLNGQDNLSGDKISEMLSIEPTGDLNNFIQTLINCGFIADTTTQSLQRVSDAITQIGQSTTAAAVPENVISVKTYSAMTEAVTAFNELLRQTSEITVDNTEVTEEYREELLKLVGSEEKVNKYFDDNNKLLVKDAKGLNNLVKSTKKNTAANASLAKSQARLQYYNLYKQIRQLVNGQQVADKATLSQINSLYAQMNVLEKTIAKYSMLENQLLDAGNAYNEFEAAQEADASTDYIGSVESWVMALGEAFNTAELGSETAQAAIAGTVPPSVYEDLDTLDEKMAAIYKYYKEGPLSQYFDIQFDDEGTITSVEMKLGNLRKVIEDGLSKGAFVGSDWQHFDLSEDIDSLEEFAKTMGVTEEVAFAFIKSIEDHDIEWLNGDYSSIFEDILPDNLANDIYENTSALADLEVQIANGKITAEEYTTKWNELTQVSQENAQKARENASAWIDASNDVNKAKTKVQELSSELDALYQQGASETEIKLKTNELEAAKKLLTDSAQKLSELETMDPVVLQVALDQAQAEIDTFEKDNSTLLAKVEIVQDAETDEYEYNIKPNIELTDDEKKKLEGYLEDVNAKYSFENALGEDIVTAEEHLSNIEKILQDIYNAATGKAPSNTPSTDSTTGTDSTNTPESFDFKAFFTETIPEELSALWTELDAFFTETIPEKWHQFWDEIGGKFNEIIEQAGILKEKVTEFFTTTVPEKWDNFWDNVGEKIGEIKEFAGQLQEKMNEFFTETLPEKWDEFWEDVEEFLFETVPYAIGYSAGAVTRFFTETVPQKWDEFWTAVSEKFNDLKEKASILKDRVVNFFTVTIPQKWSEFWDAVGEKIAELKEDAEILKDKVVDFFTVTIPEKWNEFWDTVGEKIEELKAQAEVLKNKVVDFFTITVPQKWNEFWDSVSTFITTTLPTALETVKTGVTTFFTVTLPEKINGLWDGIASWITEKATTFWENLKSGFKSGKEGEEYNPGASGAQQVNGTAHAKGTAHKTGNWGLPTSERNSLVGELGQELVVDPQSGRYYTVGDNGAEMVDLPKGAIIFNHKQTEALLSRGHVAGRGKAYAEGNAHVTIWPTASSKQQWEGTGYSGPNDPTYDLSEALATTSSDLSNAADSISDAADKFEEVFDWVEVRLEEIEEQLNLLNAQLENAVGYLAKNKIIDATLNVNNTKLTNLEKGMAEYERYAAALLAKIPSSYRTAAQNGAIAIEEFVGETDEKTLKAIQDYREWAQKAADLKQQIEELKTEIADLAKQKFDNVADQFDNQISLIEAANDKLDAQISLMEDRGYVAAKEYYESMMANTKGISAELVKERDILQSVLDEQVKLGNIKVGSDAWYEMVEQLYDVDASIVECTSDLESFQNAINDIYWDNFDELISRYEYLSDETQNLIDLMDEADMVIKPDKEDGWSSSEVSWSDEGIASLGLYAQQMEIAEYKSKQYAKAIEDLNKDYKDGKYSESEYLEKLNELKDGQYDSIEAYKDAKEAIKDLNSEMVDAVKDGLEKQIDAYSELAEKRKEALDAQKDAVDFEKSISKQQKSISDIDRQIAALSGDTSISAAAKRKQLEAERAELQSELDEMYYDRSVENQKEAIDKELEIFTESREKEIEQWEKYLEDVEVVVADSLKLVQTNASSVYDTLNEKANEYGLNVSNAVVLPWADGENAISSYTKAFGDAASSTTDQLKNIKLAWQEVIDKMTKASEVEIEAQKKANERYVAAKPETTSKPVTNTTSKPATNTTTATKSAPSVGQTVKVKKSATHFSAQSGNAKMASFVPGGSYQVMQVGVNGDKSQILIGKNGQYTGWVKLTDLEGYAKGTLGVPEDQFAFLDELGEELVMHANNGRLSFLTKGTSVIPADLTERLMDLAMNPQSMLDRNRPEISMSPSVTTNNVEITMEISEVVHIEHMDNDNLPNLTKAIDKQLDKYMKQLNGQIRRYAK